MKPISQLRFLIIDGYAKESRDEFIANGGKIASQLYSEMLLRHAPGAAFDVLYPSDPNASFPQGASAESYTGVLWTGCNLTCYHLHDERVVRQRALASTFFELGTPSFGSCWAAQIACVVAGGEVASNPKGREIGIARKIALTAEGLAHPMYQGKPPVFDAFISHDDQITRLPSHAKHLAINGWSDIQAVEIQHLKGTFWATQYHTEYTMFETARLLIARKLKMLKWGYFKEVPDLEKHVQRMEDLSREPHRKDLRWQLSADEDVLDVRTKEKEFSNWLHHFFGIQSRA